MSSTAQFVVAEVRRTLKDDRQPPVVSTDSIAQVLDQLTPEVANDCLLEPEWHLAAVALVAGTATYSVAATPELELLDLMRFASDKLTIDKTSPEHIARLNSGATTPPRGRPRFYALEPQPDQSVDLTFFPVPETSEPVDALYGVLPARWGNDATVALTIPFSRRAVDALVLRIAAFLIAMMNGERLNQLKLTPAAGMACRSQAEELLRKERLVVSRLRLAHGPIHGVWMREWRRS